MKGFQNPYVIDGDITYIKFGTKKDDTDYELKIDTKNLEKLENVSFIKYQKGGKSDHITCRLRKTYDREIAIHHLIMPLKNKKNYIDHIDRDKFNNLESNLRELTPAQSAQNRGKYSTNKSGYRNVTLDKKTGKYNICMMKNGNRHTKKGFNTAEEANEEAIKMRKRLMPFSNEDVK